MSSSQRDMDDARTRNKAFLRTKDSRSLPARAHAPVDVVYDRPFGGAYAEPLCARWAETAAIWS